MKKYVHCMSSTSQRIFVIFQVKKQKFAVVDDPSSVLKALHPCKTHTHTTLTAARVIIRNTKMHENRGQCGVEFDFKFRISV
eukprot:UN27400